jgi:hypothetical protein
MNIFNRIIVILLLLFIAVACIVSIVNIFLNLYLFTDVANRFTSMIERANPVVLALILFLILAISLVLLVLEFYKKRVQAASIGIEQSGNTMITLKTVSKQIRERLLEIEDVIKPKVKIVPKDGGIIIHISSLLTKPEHVAEKTHEIRKKASDFASEDLGFNVMQTNYTATGFTEKKQKPIEEPVQEAVPEEEQSPPAEEEHKQD